MLRLTPCGLLTLQVAAALSLTEPCPGNPSGKRRSPPLVSVSPAGAMSIVANAGDNLVCAAAIPGSTSAVTHPRCFLTLDIEPPFWAFAVVRYLPDAGYVAGGVGVGHEASPLLIEPEQRDLAAER